jgi:hypothetical protein
MFKELAPYVITATLIICTLIAIKIKKEDILTTDGIFSVAGFALGLIITSLNMIYSNNYLISLGPLLAIACLLYLRFRDRILTSSTEFNLNFDNKTLKIINILYWLCISVAIISYYQAPPYYRPPIFFITITLGATLLGLEILASKFKDNFNVFSTISKILFISLILRASAYFISPYPVGSDPWAHARYIENFLQLHHLMVTPDIVAYYCNYPIAHLLACAAKLIGNISIKESMFILGAVLALSTIFVYLIVKKITNNINLALLSMLLLNFADFHIEWSIEVIAMTFGIAIYAIIIYLILKTKEKHQLLYTSLLIIFLFIIIWTHTVSGFIALVSVISLYVGSFVYRSIYREHKYKELLVSLTFCMIFAVILITHWMDPDYPFIDSITRGLVNSLNMEAKFLGREALTFALSTAEQRGESILNIIGFLIYVFFGIIGSLYCLSRKNANKTKVSFIFMLIVLYFVFFAFPLFGIRNIMPYRWPAFIYVSLVLFVVVGLIGFLSMLKSKKQKVAFVFIVLVVTSFFMTTNFVTNMDSPIYGGEIVRRRIATESEMTLSRNVDNFYNGTIMRYYALTPAGDISWNYMKNNLFIWKRISLTRSVRVQILIDVGSRAWPEILLGEDYKNQLDGNCSCIYDTGGSRAYLEGLGWKK